MAVAGLAAACLFSCGGRRPAVSVRPDGPVTGLYKVHLFRSGEKARSFRLLLFARLPDRIHAEVLTPVGSTAMILDGGGGKLAVTLVRERRAFVGHSSPAIMERVFGLRLSVEELVRGLLTGDLPETGYAVVREATVPAGLPDRVEIASPSSRMILELKRLRPLGAAVESLGTGAPPPGLEIVALDELYLDEIPGSDVAEDGS